MKFANSKLKKSNTLGFSAILMLSIAAPTMALSADIAVGTDPGYVEPSIDPQTNSALWEGIYGGALLGYDWQNANVNAGPDVDGVNGKKIGGYLGYNTRLGDAFVGGLELQGLYSGAEGTTGALTVRKDFETSLRARMGYAIEQNLIYGLAGLSASRVKMNDATSSDRNWMKGWTVGAGLERSFTQNIVGRVEYDYSDFGEESFTLGSGNFNTGLKSHGVKVGVGFKF